MDSQEYKQVFDTRLREDSQAAGKWETEQGGEYYAAGVGSAITGRGADLLLLMIHTRSKMHLICLRWNVLMNGTPLVQDKDFNPVER